MLGETRYANNPAPQPLAISVLKRATSLPSLQGGGDALNTSRRKSLDGNIFGVLKQSVTSSLPRQSAAISNRSVRLSINTSNTPSIASPSAMSPSTVSPGSVMRSPTSPYENNTMKCKAIIYGNENKEEAIKKYDDFLEDFSVAEDYSIKEKTFVFYYKYAPEYENFSCDESAHYVNAYAGIRDIDLNDNADVEFIIKKFIDNCNPDEVIKKEFKSALYSMGQALNYKNIKEVMRICRDSCKNNVSPSIELQKFLDSIKKENIDLTMGGKEKISGFKKIKNVFKKSNDTEENSNYERCVNSFRKDKKNGEEELKNLSCRWLSYKELEVHTVGIFSIKRKKYININKKSGIREVAKIFSNQCNFTKIEKEVFYKKLKYRVNAVKSGSASFERESFIKTLESFGDTRKISYFNGFFKGG